ncbi:armadillo-type protein [Globomyces pollinis-pini]|nr:armadillo-type protein [Globomyces pollinis-pini]
MITHGNPQANDYQSSKKLPFARESHPAGENVCFQLNEVLKSYLDELIVKDLNLCNMPHNPHHSINHQYNHLPYNIHENHLYSTTSVPASRVAAFDYVNNAAAQKIQATYRGYLTRKQQMVALRKECLDLRQELKDKESSHFNEINHRDLIIQDLRKKLNGVDYSSHLVPTETFPITSSRSTLFTQGLDLSNRSSDTLAESFYNLKLNSSNETPFVPRVEDSLPFSLPLPNQCNSPNQNYWGPKSTDTLPETEISNSDFFRQIWSPLAPVQTKGPAKSLSNPNLPNIYENIEASLSSNVNSSFSTQPFNDTNDLKNTFKTLVEKIVKTNDQPCSIFLQQRLRVESAEVKGYIFDAIMGHVLSLMKNRFGNFLVQCCLECGTELQAQALCQKMKGHVIQLSCDRFGCHVMQKAIEKVGDEVKMNLISELFPSIPETFTHRFACHVWQRIFEIKWKDGRSPNYMSVIQNAVVGQWASIANDENGSLVVQCIFEHVTPAEKAPVIEEIFQCTAEISKGQWGNWVTQHLLEHGTIAEQNHITSVVLDNVYSMSVDQYASKVVEKCVKIASKRDLQQFVDEILRNQPDRDCPYILSMMNNQYGNYVVQNVLSVAETNQRDHCVRLLAPHIPLLRASKYGQRVASLCEKYIRLGQHKFNSSTTIGSNSVNF